MKQKTIFINLEVTQIKYSLDSGHYEIKLSYTLMKPNRLKEIDKRDIVYHTEVEHIMGQKAVYSEALNTSVYKVAYENYEKFMAHYSLVLPKLLNYVESRFKN